MPPTALRSVLAGLLLALPLAAQEAKPKVDPPPAAGPKAATPAKEVDPKAIEALRKAFAAQQAKKTFKVKMRLTNAPAGNNPGDMDMEFSTPDRIRMKGSGMQIIVVGEKAAMQMGEKWVAAPASVAKSGLNASDPKKVEEMIQNCRIARSLGSEKVDGVDLDAFEFVVARKDGSSKTKFLISPADSLPRRVEIEADAKGVAIKSTLEYYDYGAAVSIELPPGF